MNWLEKYLDKRISKLKQESRNKLLLRILYAMDSI